MRKKITHENFIKRLQNTTNSKYTVLESYKGMNVKIKVQHNCSECSYHRWLVTPINLLNGSGCPKCNNIQKTMTHEEFNEKIKEKYNGEFILLTKYKKSNQKIKVKHNSKHCKYYLKKKEYFEWEIVANDLLTKKKRCPVCFNSKVVIGVNSIYDTDPWMITLGVCEEDAKRYTSGSGQKIIVTCPDCNNQKEITISKIKKRKSIQCACHKSKSYPEKFMMNILEQLHVDYITEYEDTWTEKKRYDFFIKSKNLIIETHGKQHFQQTKGFGREIKVEKENDKNKENIALNNGIKHYIQLDCSESNMNYIKKSILNSKIKELFDLSKINWNKCSEFATSNIVKDVCKYWKNKEKSENTTDLAKKFKLSRKTIVNYLGKGTKFKWCEYNAEIESKKASHINGKSNGKKVEIFKNKESLGIFNSVIELARQSEDLFNVKLNRHYIYKVCNGKQKHHKGYIFKYINDNIE